jgi:hypothetical protein
MTVHGILTGLALAVLVTGACERPQDRPLRPDLPAPTPPEPTDSGDPDADTGRTIGPIAEVNAAAQAGSLGQSGAGSGGTLGSGGAGGFSTGGRSIH